MGKLYPEMKTTERNPFKILSKKAVLPTERNVAYMQIVKNESNDKNITGFLLLSLIKLENREIEYVIINNIIFNRKNFEFKNGKFNRSSFVSLTPWAYELELINKLINSKHEIGL